ncbi:hypothetical protein SK571_13530 [Lentzea sp. BCCO 10_0798]|uniref:50S ribosomal protein L29 n=1 Tax=Lentzea kristufekii TaxID=3095430 RepID=A0ABU4TQ32_9PSEU|nr:hypothetical protein [Lentzea sp. BCCO 10_0798]MDX8050407.1 hypothetical protein [Lentzea sp. BCCO 10_0798]
MEEPKVTKDEANDGMIDALLHERQGYVQREAGSEDDKAKAAMRRRIAQVDEQLALRGYQPGKSDETEQEAPAEPPVDPADPPKGTTPAGKRGQQTRA